MCNVLNLTYDAVHNGVLRNIDLLLVLKATEMTVAPQVCLFIEHSL